MNQIHQSRFRGRTFYLSYRDVKVLNFLWTWKLASTATIHQAIVRPGSRYSAYKVMERLEKHGYVRPYVSGEHRFTAWQLTEKGFLSIKNSLGELTEEGYLSEYPWHDRHILAFQLGEWSWFNLPVVAHFTEQDLRRRPADLYPAWVPHTPGHRADGYTKIEGKGRTWVFALEVELSLKSIARYESVIRYYRTQSQVDRVLWLTSDPSVMNAIKTAKTNVKDAQDTYHVFVDLKDYQENGWDAKITNERSETLFTMREHIGVVIGDPYREYIGTVGGVSKVTDHYDPVKVLGKSRASRSAARATFSD